MFGKNPELGFIPAPVIDLYSGYLYNVVISVLVALCFIVAFFVVFSRSSRKNYPLFLGSASIFWSFVALGNLLAWLGVLGHVRYFAVLLKMIGIVPFVFLASFLCEELCERKILYRSGVVLYTLISAIFLYVTITRDGSNTLASFWGLQWQVSGLALDIFRFGMLLPLGVGVVFLILDGLVRTLVHKKKVSFSLYLSVLIFIFLEALQIGVGVVSWQRMLLRLLYIVVAFLIYLHFTEGTRQLVFLPRQMKTVERFMPRVPFFVKLIVIFLVLSVIPITISSLLMFVSFKEIIDIYIYKPLLWNLKVSREAFLMALSRVQLQVLFLMSLSGILVFAAAVIVSRAISKSLHNITDGMEKVSKGDFSFKLRRESNDEIGDVVNYFNSMSAEIERSRNILEDWNHELEIKVKERTEDLSTLYNVSRAVGSTLDLELLFGRIADQLMPFLKAEVCLLFVSEGKNKLTLRFKRGLESDPLSVGEESGLMGEAVVRKQILYSDHVSDDPRCEAGISRIFGLKTFIACPMRSKGKTVGVLCFGTRGEHHYSDERDVYLLTAISEELAVAVENTGIYENEKKAVERLTQLDVLKNQFISLVSHELRTPLIASDGYVTLLKDGVYGPITEEQSKYLSIVHESNQGLTIIINQLLDFSKIESGHFKVDKKLISINEVIHEAMEGSKASLNKDQAVVKLNFLAKNVNFMGDIKKMVDVIVNLITNTLKFKKEGASTRIEITTEDAENFIRIEISDNGIGIGEEYLEKIFNKFYQIEDFMTRKVGGVGLGLSIAKEIVAAHGGKMWAESLGKDKGATVIFTLPVAEKA